jgi:HAD superfamily hydrolase (TIGR01509 family)
VLDTLSAERTTLLDGAWETAELMPGAASLVARLAERGVAMAIATSSSSIAAGLKLRRHEAVRRAMRAIVCADHPLVRRPKPAPDIFLAAAAALGVEPSACLVIEDAPSGVVGAVAAGMRVIAVPAPSLRADPAFEAAERVVGGLDEIEHLG